MTKRFAFSLLLITYFLLLTTYSHAQPTYPQLDITGFKKWEYKKVDVDPSRNYFSGLTHLGGFYPTFTGGPWQERLQLKILGELSESLSVAYDLEQQPETPDKFNVKVKYNNNELTFGDFNANFSGNEFVSAAKYLNGVMLTAKDSWYDIVTVPSAKLKSQTQALTTQKGNNIKGPYNLGHGSIVEGTEQIQLNGIYLRRNTDYTIDYFEGKITFNRILSQTDEFKYTYEYTNILDLFFPSLSKRDFFGFQSRFSIDPEKFGRPAAKEEPVIIAARTTFPAAGTLEGEIQEEEASGRYRLANFPVKKLSEALTFMGAHLKKDEDYIIRYDTGEIKLLTRFLPATEEVLTVDYKYHQTSAEAETIAGIGSRGPYKTKYQPLVPEREKVEVDGKLFVRDLDYTIKYPSGDLMFGVIIGPTSQIKISYVYNVAARPETTPSKFPKELKLGATYLNESAKKGTASPQSSAIETYTGQSIITNNYVLNLRNRPVLPTSEASLVIRLKRGSQTLPLTWETDFLIPTVEVDATTGYARVTPNVQLGYITDRSDPTDGYAAGAIAFIRQDLLATDEVTVAYTYKKSIVGKFSGVGTGSKGPYYLRNVREVVPGTETVQVWDQGSSLITTYTRNGSYEGNAGDTGYSINYSKENPSITFNKELASSKNFQIIYQYVPPALTTGDKLSLTAYGFDGSFKIGDAFKMDSSFARSETDQVFVAETTVETFAGNNTKSYSLHSPADIIEASEKLYVNNRLLNKDIDYFITYSKPGSFNFFYITPTTADAISVEYNFQSLAGIEVGARVKADSAARLGAETKLFGDVLTLSGNTKKIGFDFSPLGGTAIGVGSEYDEYNVNFKPAVQSFYTTYAYKHNKNPLGTSRLTFLRSYDNSLTTGLNPSGLAKVDFSYRNFYTLDDPLSGGALHNSDNLQEAYSGSLAPAEWRRGALGFTQKYDFRKTTSKNDVVDRGDARTTSNIDYYHLAQELKLTERLSVGYDYQSNEPLTLSSLETETAHSRVIDNSYNFSVDLTSWFLQKWTARVSLLNHDELRITPTPESLTSTKNETYHVDLNPFAILTGSLDHNRQERTTFVAGGENPLTLRTTGASRFSPLAWFSAGFNASRSETIPETGSTNKTTGRNLGYDVDYTPLSLSFLKLSSRWAIADAYTIAPLGAARVKTDTYSLTKNYTLSLTAVPILPLTFGYIEENYSNKNDATTQPISTETQNQTLTANTSLSLPFFPQLTLAADYTQKITGNLKTGASRPKLVVNGKISYQVVNWGTLLYDLSVERNKGEVQAGSIADLNLKKTTQTISLNIVIPVDNPVLSNFTLLASLKTVDYKNYNNAPDDFKASLLSFEGTMNF